MDTVQEALKKCNTHTQNHANVCRISGKRFGLRGEKLGKYDGKHVQKWGVHLQNRPPSPDAVICVRWGPITRLSAVNLIVTSLSVRRERPKWAWGESGMVCFRDVDTVVETAQSRLPEQLLMDRLWHLVRFFSPPSSGTRLWVQS